MKQHKTLIEDIIAAIALIICFGTIIIKTFQVLGVLVWNG